MNLSAAREQFQRIEIAAVVTFFVDRRFENERLTAQFGVHENAAERFAPDVAFANVRVPIDIRAVGELRIVGVNHAHVVETDRRAGVLHHRAQSEWRGDVEASSQEVTRIEAISDLQIGDLTGEIKYECLLHDGSGMLGSLQVVPR